MTTIDDVISSPGEILLEEFLEPLGISQYRLAKAIGKPQSAVSEIVHGQRAITPEMAVLLGKALSTSPQFWLNLEMAYQLKMVDSSSFAHVTPLVDELAEARLLGRIAQAEREYATGQYSDGPSAIASLKEQT